MLERLAGKALNNFLSKYFEDGDESNSQQDSATSASSSTGQRSQKTSFYSGVWSGFLSLEDLRLKVAVVNAQLAAKGIPMELVHCSIRKMEMTIPWSQWKVLTSSGSKNGNSNQNASKNPSRDTAILVLDGVHILVKMNYEIDDELMKTRAIAKRRKHLKEATEGYANKSDESSNGNAGTSKKLSWKEYLKQRLQEGLLPAIADNLQIHIRDFHVRIEDCESDPSNPFALGVVLESMHVQHDLEAQRPDETKEKSTDTEKSPLIRKVAELNHFGIYWNALVDNNDINLNSSSHHSTVLETPAEKRILQFSSHSQIVEVLDNSICRRATRLPVLQAPSASLNSFIPQHTYLLHPVDGRLDAAISAEPKNLKSQPAMSVVCTITDVTFDLRDYQCIHALRLVHSIKEHKYSQRYRRYRPNVSVKEDPRAWWFYAVSAIRYELTESRLRWSWNRFRRRFDLRKRYCDLYERQRLTSGASDIADDESDLHREESFRPLSQAERIEFESIEDGTVGDLSVQDIILFRILVDRRIGSSPTSTTGGLSSWLRQSLKSIVGDEVEEEEYRRLLEYWDKLSKQSDDPGGGDIGNISSLVAISFKVDVEKGKLSLFRPLASTADQKHARRLQERFLDFRYDCFHVGTNIMGDYDSLSVTVSLENFVAQETRSDRHTYSIISRIDCQSHDGVVPLLLPPLFSLHITKNPPGNQDFDYGLQLRLQALEVTLTPNCEWIQKAKTFAFQIPRLRKAGQFWNDISMAYINSWASKKLGLLAKAETAISQHKPIDVDFVVKFPVLRIAANDESLFVIDLGTAYLRTARLAGVADKELLRSVASNTPSPRKRSGLDHDESTFPFHGDDSSIKRLRPRRLSRTFPDHRTPLKAFDSSQLSYAHSHNGMSVDLGVSVELDDDSLPVEVNGDYRRESDSLFYDQYELRIQTGGITIVTPSCAIEQVAERTEIRVSLQKSIIPADHTLSKYKAFFAIDDILFSVNQSQIQLMHSTIKSWTTVFSSKTQFSPSHLDKIASTRKLIDDSSPLKLPAEDRTEKENEFDENEFFDALENESYVSDHVSILMDENWISDSESVLHDEVHSISSGGRRRRRQSSVSDVSSISEGSTRRRRMFHNLENEHLTAENLARLEEEGGEDEGIEEPIESDVDSFHSAISLSHLVNISHAMENDMKVTEAQILQLKEKLSAFRRAYSSSDSQYTGDSSQQQLKNQYRLDLERLKVENKALKAAHLDLLTQIRDSKDMEGASELYEDQLMSAARRATTLLHNVKRRQKSEANSGPEHSIVRDLKRELFQITLLLKRITVKVRDSDSLHDCAFCVAQTALVARQSVGDTKLYASIDYIGVSVHDDDTTDVNGDEKIILVGGIDDCCSRHNFPVQFPQFISPTVMDEKFFKIAFELRGLSHQKDSPENCKKLDLAKLRLVVGEVELNLDPISITKFHGCLSKMVSNNRREMLPKHSGPPNQRSENDSPKSIYYDIVFRMAALRCMLNNRERLVGGLNITDFGWRAAGSYAKIPYKDRVRVDLRCGNIQALYIPDSGSVIELFGKRDVFSSLIRFSLKLQYVPEEIDGGWVLDVSSRDALVDSNEKDSNKENANIQNRICVWNCHIGIKVDNISIVFVPIAIVEMKDCVFAMKNILKRESEDNADIDESEASVSNKAGIDTDETSVKCGFGGIPIRWRIDLSLKDSSVCVQGLVLKPDGQTPNGNLKVSFSAKANMQLSRVLPEGVRLQLSMHNLSLSRTTDHWTIVDPTTLNIRAEYCVKSRFCVHLRKPQLSLPFDFPWDDTPPDLRNRGIDENWNADGGDSLCLLLSKTKLNLATSVFITLIETSRLFSDLTKRDSSNQNKEKKVFRKRGARKIKALMSLNNLSLCFVRERLHESNFLMAEPIASLSFEDISASFSTNENMMSFKIAVFDGLLVDYSSRNGVRSLGFEKHPCDGKACEVMAMSGETVEVSGRLKVSLNIRLGRIQFLLLPSLVRSFFGIQNDVKRTISLMEYSGFSTNQEPKVQHGSSSLGEKISSISFVIAAEGFELILSSKDIPKYIRDMKIDPIGVVTFRLKFQARGSLRVFLLDEDLKSLSELTFGAKKSTSLEKTFTEYIVPRVKDGKTMKAILSGFELSVHEFQALRTSILKSNSMPYYFSVIPPAAGEQRITNSFGFSISHQLAGVSMPPARSEATDAVVRLSHAIQIRAGFVDILVYISQSSAGISEAIRVSVKPILEILKDGKKKENPNDSNKSNKSGLKEWILGASVVFSLKSDGLKFTVVPGGATRLTESPIVKLSLFRLSLGSAATQINSENKTISDANLEAMASASGLSASHLVFGAWLNCDVSASYHNRRLVAWEPFIEPWTLKVRCGADLVRALKLPPIFHGDPKIIDSDISGQSAAVALLELGGGRLRDFGRLLRAPFISDRSTEKNSDRDKSLLIQTDSDFCFLALFCSAEDTISAASFAQAGLMPSSLLPGSSPTYWLQRFGFPEIAELDSKNVLTFPALVCWISDSVTLNFNITGALVDNVSEFAITARGDKGRRLAPHWIKNESGLTIRYHEVLDFERACRGEKSPKVILANGSEVPLSLKRTSSQSCDPHTAHIVIELGSFEDTIGRVRQGLLTKQKGSRSSTFSYKVIAKVPVDTVGVHRYPLDWNTEKRPEQPEKGKRTSLGWIIVRVALRGGIKMVSIESPLVLTNVSDTDLLCEVRDHGGLSLIWRGLVKKQVYGAQKSFLPIPADMVPLLHDGKSNVFSVVALPQKTAYLHESDVDFSTDMDVVTRIAPPAPYSRASFSRGLIAEEDVTVRVCGKSEYIHLNLCSLRIGSFVIDHTTKNQSQVSKSAPEIPEQQMLVFRSTITIRNHLALPARVQVRVKSPGLKSLDSAEQPQAALESMEWIDLGVLGCGTDSCWTGALPTDEVVVRIRLMGQGGSASRQFPSWSEPIIVPSDLANMENVDRLSRSQEPFKLGTLKLHDSSGSPLLLCASLNRGELPIDQTNSPDNIKLLSTKLPPASRVISIYAPFWIVDGTGLDLQYKSGSFIAGQVDASLGSPSNGDLKHSNNSSTLGLGELLDDSNLIYLPSRKSFEVLMIGDEGTAQLHVRRRLSRETDSSQSNTTSPWSDPIPLTAENRRYHDTSVLPPPRIFDVAEKTLGASDVPEPFALRSKLVRAPDILGGSCGTRLVHVICRYAVVNELGREIEVSGNTIQGGPLVINADGRPRSFHFDDSGSIRFRPREFGWQWSGSFNIRASQRELLLRLRHKLKGHSIIVSVDFRAKQDAGTCLIVFRMASNAPYRIENHTIYPLQYRQLSRMLTVDSLPNRSGAFQDSVILPYHHADFAWDEPEYGRRAVLIEVADFGNIPKGMHQTFLGSFRIDSISPGTEIKLASPYFVCAVDADGPTRVLRISEPSAPGAESTRTESDHFQRSNEKSLLSIAINIKLSYGIGLSIVDWHPQELFYVRLDDVAVSLVNDGITESVTSSIGSIIVDNQLWVTPYPVMLRMGSRSAKRRNRRQSALSASWRRFLIAKKSDRDFTLLESVRVSALPLHINVDGNLAAFALEMVKRAKQIGAESGTFQKPSRDNELKRVLGIEGSGEAEMNMEHTSQESKSLFADSLYTAVDYMATGAIAAKLRSQYRPPDQAGSTNKSNGRSWDHGDLSKPSRKIYIERLRLSTIIAELSWSGFLPVASSLPRLLRPALTFEGLPLLLRPYTASHAYGTIDEHILSLRFHYLSISRILDLLVGVLTRPAFIVRACIFTWRESFASAFDSVANGLQVGNRALEALHMKTMANYPSMLSSQLSRVLIDPAIRFNILVLGTLSHFLTAGSNFLRYDAARHRAGGGLVRSRNPRLFANVEGKELLVEYVEGENAGKALLSRVRMGAYLGEGYLYHIEKAYLPKTTGRNDDIESLSLILMLTFDRVLLLNGMLDTNFCDVVWESAFANLVHVDYKSSNNNLGTVFFWYMREKCHTREERYAKSLVSDASSGGLETLHCKTIFVPKASIKLLLSKIKTINERLLEAANF